MHNGVKELKNIFRLWISTGHAKSFEVTTPILTKKQTNKQKCKTVAFPSQVGTKIQGNWKIFAREDSKGQRK